MLKRLSKDGINALTLRISALGRKRAGKRAFDSVRRFAAADKLYLIAVLPAGKPHTPAGRLAAAACSKHRFFRLGLRCAVRAKSPAAAARLARRHNSVRRLVAVYVKGPRRLARAARLPGATRRPVILVAPLDKSFDAAVWGSAIGQTAASASVDLGVAPRSRRASAALEQFGAILASESGAAGAADTTPPATPTGLAPNSITQNSMTLSWNVSTDDVGVAGYRLFENGAQVGTATSTAFTFAGLACGTAYTFGVAAYDAAGNVSNTATTSQSTTPCSDTQPPSEPTGLTVGGVGSTTALLSWNAASDNVGVTGYHLYVNGSEVGTSLTTSYLFSGLTCETAYTFGVVAADAAGNVSPIASVIAQTATCSDTQPPSTPTGLTTDVGDTSVTLSWAASTDSVGVAGYRLFLNGSQVASASSTSYSFTGLSCGTSYTFGVAAYDAAGNVSGTATLQGATHACPDTQPPSTPSALAASSVTQTSAKLSWKASSDNVGVTGYQLFLNGSPVGTTTARSYSFTGLTCGTTYTLGVAAYDAAGNGSATATLSQATSSCPDTQPPSTPLGLATSGPGPSSVTLSWIASTDDVGVAGYRLFLNGTQVGTSTSMSYSFTGLACGTPYTLGVAAYDAAGNVSGTATLQYSTSTCSDTQAPSTPTGLGTNAVGQTGMTLSWGASTDNVGVTGYRLFLNGTQVGTSGSTSYSFTGLTCGTSYTLGVAAYDASGNVSATATLSQATSSCPDTQPPSTPAGLAASSVAQTSVKLSWNASTDNVGVTGYRLYSNGTQVGTSSSTSYSFTGLTCGTSYTLGVAAYDAAGNASPMATLAQATSTCPDTQSPSTPTGLGTSSVTQTGATLSWSASTDNVGVTGYRLFLNGTQVGTSTGRSYAFTGLACGTSYTLGVAAYDAAGNVSATASATAATSACASGAGLASIFVSPTGSDSTCTRSSSPVDYAHASVHVCATPAKACKLAQSGDVVILEDGTYKSHLDGCAEGHQNYSQNVVFEPEPGHECPMTYPGVPAPWSDTGCDVNISGDSGDGQLGLSLGGNDDKTCGVTGHPLPSTLSASAMATWDTHLTFKGIYVGDMSAICSAFIELDDDAGNHFYVGEGAYHFYILGGDYGNRTDAEQPTIGDTLCGCNNWPPAQDVRMESAVVHDFVTQGSGHGDGIFVDPSYGVQIVKNVLARDDCIPIYVNYATSEAESVGVHGLRIIGNVVHTDTIHNGGARCYQGISLGNNDQTDTIVAFNSVELPIRRSNTTEINQGIEIVGNIVGEIDAASAGNLAGCGSGTTASYNVLLNVGASGCGDTTNTLAQGQTSFTSVDTQPNSPSGTSQFFTAPLGDYTLATASAGGLAVGKVPTSWCDANPGVCPSTDILGSPRPNPAHPSYYDAGAYETR